MTACFSSRIACRLLVLTILLSGTLLAQSGPAAANAVMANPRPGDRVVVQIFGGEEQRRADTVTIDPRGRIALEKLGVVAIGSLTIGEVPDTVRARYARYLREPTVDVMVLRRIAVNGEVRRPEVYYVDASTRLADAIAHAGGISETGSRTRVSIVRNGESIAVPDWDRPNSPNTELLSGDVIVVGRRPWLVLNILPAISTMAVVTSVLITLVRR